MNAQIQKIVDDFIALKGLEGQRAALEPALEEALNWVNEKVPSDVFNLAAIGSANKVTHAEQDKRWCNIFSVNLS